MTTTPNGRGHFTRVLADISVVALGVFNIWVAGNALPTGWLVGLTFLTAIALTLRRRAPLTAFAATLPAVVLVSAILGPMAALYTVARSSTRRWIVVAAALTLAALLLTGRPDIYIAQTDIAMRFLDVFLVMLIGAAPAALGWLAAAQDQLTLQMAELDRASSHERRLLIAAARARERAELAREMHDVVSHQVSLIAVQAGAMQMVSKDPDTRDTASTIRQLSVGTLDELRHMVSVLRDPGGGDHGLRPQPTLAALPHLLSASALSVQVIGEPPSDLSAASERAIYRTVQEALTNVRKHAPGASVAVEFIATDNSVFVSITNNHSDEPSLSLPGTGSGITGLQQRAELLGGAVTARPLADEGWKVELQLPRA